MSEFFCDVPEPLDGTAWARKGTSWQVICAGIDLSAVGQDHQHLDSLVAAAERLANAKPEDRSDVDRRTLGLCTERVKGCPPGESVHRWCMSPWGWGLEDIETASMLAHLPGVGVEASDGTPAGTFTSNDRAMVERYHNWPSPKTESGPEDDKPAVTWVVGDLVECSILQGVHTIREIQSNDAAWIRPVEHPDEDDEDMLVSVASLTRLAEVRRAQLEAERAKPAAIIPPHADAHDMISHQADIFGGARGMLDGPTRYRREDTTATSEALHHCDAEGRPIPSETAKAITAIGDMLGLAPLHAPSEVVQERDIHRDRVADVEETLKQLRRGIDSIAEQDPDSWTDRQRIAWMHAAYDLSAVQGLRDRLGQLRQAVDAALGDHANDGERIAALGAMSTNADSQHAEDRAAGAAWGVSYLADQLRTLEGLVIMAAIERGIPVQFGAGPGLRRRPWWEICRDLGVSHGR